MKNEDNLKIIGTLMPQSEEQDANKFVPLWKQEATDEKGRKRFHGAFTGGFSAGYFNTVGSKEGWTPAAYVSSKKNRAEAIKVTKEAFMDEDDIRELGGLATLVATETFESFESDQVVSSKESIGMRLLKMMGFKGELTVSPAISVIQQSQKIFASFKLSDTKEEGKMAGGFGVGVLEEEDEDIYEYETKAKFSKIIEDDDDNKAVPVMPGFGSSFVKSQVKEEYKWFDPPIIPADYVPAKVDEKEEWLKNEAVVKNSKVFLSAEERGHMLGEVPLPSSEQVDLMSKFTIPVDVASLALSGFMPFDSKSEKHSRYIRYLEFFANLSSELPQFPPNYSQIQIDHEKEEFFKAAHIFRPMSSLMAQRFKSTLPQNDNLLDQGLKIFTQDEIDKRKEKKVEDKKQKIVYAKKDLKRTQFIWFPSLLLCKRFHINPPRLLEEQQQASKSVEMLSNDSIIKIVKDIKGIDEAEELRVKLDKALEDGVDAEIDRGLPEKRPPLSLFKSIFGDDEDLVEEEPLLEEKDHSKPVFTKPSIINRKSKLIKKSIQSTASASKVQLDYLEEEFELEKKRPSSSDMWK